MIRKGTLTDDISTRERRKFPVGRALVAFFIVPPSTIFLMLLISRLFFVASIGPEQRKEQLQDLYGLPALAIVYSSPGHLAFLILGLPTVYIMHRLNRTGFPTFAVLGAAYTFLPFVLLGFGGTHPPTLGGYVFARLLEFAFVGPIGAVGGVLTRWIVFGGR